MHHPHLTSGADNYPTVARANYLQGSSSVSTRQHTSTSHLQSQTAETALLPEHEQSHRRTSTRSLATIKPENRSRAHKKQPRRTLICICTSPQVAFAVVRKRNAKRNVHQVLASIFRQNCQSTSAKRTCIQRHHGYQLIEQTTAQRSNGKNAEPPAITAVEKTTQRRSRAFAPTSPTPAFSTSWSTARQCEPIESNAEQSVLSREIPATAQTKLSTMRNLPRLTAVV